MLYTSSATLALVAPLALSGVVANADTTTPVKTTQTVSKDNNQAPKTATASSKDNGQAPKPATASSKDNGQAPKPATASSKDNNQAQRPDAPKLTNNAFYQDGFLKGSFFNNFVKAPRFSGSNYNASNKGYSTSVTATHDNSTLSYNIQTYNSNGTPSNKPFAIGISKNGSPYKLIKSTTGSLKGSLTVNEGTYTLQVLTPQSAGHFTGGLSVN